MCECSLCFSAVLPLSHSVDWIILYCFFLLLLLQHTRKPTLIRSPVEWSSDNNSTTTESTCFKRIAHHAHTNEQTCVCRYSAFTQLNELSKSKIIIIIASHCVVKGMAQNWFTETIHFKVPTCSLFIVCECEICQFLHAHTHTHMIKWIHICMWAESERRNNSKCVCDLAVSISLTEYSSSTKTIRRLLSRYRAAIKEPLFFLWNNN